MKTFLNFRHFSLLSLVNMGIAVLLLTSCSSKILQVRPVSGDVAWIEGREVTRVEQNGVVVVASYEFEDAQHVVLDIEVKNRTATPLLISPDDFDYIPLVSHTDTLREQDKPTFTPTYLAADPEQKIKQAALDMKREKRRLVAMSIFNGVVLVATIASDINSASRDKNWSQQINSRVTHDQLYNVLLNKQGFDINYYRSRKAQLAHERENWQTLALRNTTVAPGESVRGLVFLPKDARASHLLVRYKSPVDDSVVPLKFAQELVKIRR